MEREILDLGIASYETPQFQGKAVMGGGATPGVGEGIDLIFIMKPTPGEQEEDPVDQFIKDLTKYVKTILLVRQTNYYTALSRDQQYKEVYNVDDIVDHLAWITWKSRGTVKVRRLRIIAHGQKGSGAVKMALRTTKPTGGQNAKIEPKRRFVLPSDLVKEFVNEPNRQVVRAAMTKDALVEFWGCYIADALGAGAAWSSIFESTFRATSEEVMTGFHHYILHRGRDRVKNTSEIDRLDTATQRRFRNWLLERYREFVRNGDIRPIEGEKAQIHLMRNLFDISDGDLKYLVVNIFLRGPRFRPGEGRKVRPGDPKGWGRIWRDFTF